MQFRCHAVLMSLALLIATPALAATITLNDSYGAANGGEFRAVAVGLPFVPVDSITNQAGAFATFCLEKNEYFSFGQTYFAAVATATVHGGVGGGDPDPLDPRTAYLYERCVTGNLADYTYSLGDGGAARAASADALQHVIWYIEQEESKTWDDGDNSLMDRFYQDALINAGSTIGNVRVLNLWGDQAMQSLPAQDQLVLMPEPSATLLAIVGLGIFCWSRRRS